MAATTAFPDSPPLANGNPGVGPGAGSDAASVPPGPPPAPPHPPTEPASSAAGGRRPARTTLKLGGIVAAVALAAGVGGGVVAHELEPSAPATATVAASTAPHVSPVSLPSSAGTSSIDVHAVVAAVEPSVVQVTSQLQGGTAIGTGFVISADGQILTNAHVVDGAQQVTVRLSGESSARPATVVGADTQHDVALLSVSGVSGLHPAQLGSSQDVQVGDPLVAIGYALGLRGDPTVTSGIVSGTDRTLDQLTGLLQTDAAINPGNSGGPLVDAAGKVIGINTAKVSGNGSSPFDGDQPGFENVGFAIPIEEAQTIANQLRSGGTPAVQSGYLGVSVSDTPDGSLGATVGSVVDGGPAAKAGLQAGDVITAVGNTPISGAADLGQAVADAGAGKTVTVTVQRNGSPRQVSVTLGSKP
jgi:putative serine protease PepD